MMNLTIKDRLVLAVLYPKESDLVTQVLVRDIRNKVQLTQEEIKTTDFQVVGGGYKWNQDIKSDKDYEFTDAEIALLKEGVKNLDKEKKITAENLDICEKIKNYTNTPKTDEK